MTKILLVDDYFPLLKLLEQIFLSKGWEVVLAEDGEVALDKVEAEKPDLIILEIIMPRMNGFEVLENLKANSTTKSIPVMLYTRLHPDLYREKLTNLEVATYLWKYKYHPRELVDIAMKIHNNYQDKVSPQ